MLQPRACGRSFPPPTAPEPSTFHRFAVSSYGAGRFLKARCSPSRGGGGGASAPKPRYAAARKATSLTFRGNAPYWGGQRRLRRTLDTPFGWILAFSRVKLRRCFCRLISVY